MVKFNDISYNRDQEKRMKRTAAFLLVSILLPAFRCSQFPYQPEPEPGVTTGSAATAEGTIYAINSGRQICNPSISQDTVNLKGCMLWLNFADTLAVDVPDSFPLYTKKTDVQHDRLTITDRTNTVRWYMIKPADVPVDKEIQDPEWSTHPNFLAFLGKDAANKWDGYAAKIAPKAAFKFNEDSLTEFSTPHIWIGGTPASFERDSGETPGSGFATRAEIIGFFGTDSVRIAWSILTTGIYFVDYSAANLQVTMIPRPAGKDDYYLESGLISPDGRWIAYNCYQNLEQIEAYAQQLTADSRPFLIEPRAADPHWWRHPDGRLFIVYSTTGGVTKGDLAAITDGSLGYTMKQEVRLFPEGPAYMQFEKINQPQELVNLPFKGGLSPDGFSLCTGYEFAFIYNFN